MLFRLKRENTGQVRRNTIIIAYFNMNREIRSTLHRSHSFIKSNKTKKEKLSIICLIS